MSKFRPIWNRVTAQRLQRVVSFLAVLALLFASLPIRPASAAAVTSLKDTLSRLKASTLADHTIQFVTPTGADASTDTITLTFGSGFTMGTFSVNNVDLAVGDSGTCATAVFTDKTLAATPGTSPTWGVAQAAQVITFTAPTNAAAGEITAARCVQIEIGSNATSGAAGATQITNPTAGGTTVAIAGAFGDSGTLAIDIEIDEQVAITATVDPTITFAVSDNAIGFGTLSASTGRWATGDALGGNASAATPTAAHTLTLATNAQSGWAITYNGATLTSGANTVSVASIRSDSDGTPGTEQFALSASTDGNATIASGYARSATASWNFVAGTTTTLVSETTSTATETISASYLANIAATTEAGSYTTTITYIATATF